MLPIGNMRDASQSVSSTLLVALIAFTSILVPLTFGNIPMGQINMAGLTPEAPVRPPACVTRPPRDGGTELSGCLRV